MTKKSKNGKFIYKGFIDLLMDEITIFIKGLIWITIEVCVLGVLRCNCNCTSTSFAFQYHWLNNHRNINIWPRLVPSRSLGKIILVSLSCFNRNFIVLLLEFMDFYKWLMTYFWASFLLFCLCIMGFKERVELSLWTNVDLIWYTEKEECICLIICFQWNVALQQEFHHASTGILSCFNQNLQIFTSDLWLTSEPVFCFFCLCIMGFKERVELSLWSNVDLIWYTEMEECICSIICFQWNIMLQ